MDFDSTFGSSGWVAKIKNVGGFLMPHYHYHYDYDHPYNDYYHHSHSTCRVCILQGLLGGWE